MSSKAGSELAKPRQRTQWRHAVAGCTAGLTTTLTLHPLDVIKTRLQVQDGAQAGLPAYRGTLDALRSMVRQEGWRGLYAGLSPALLGSTLAWGCYFFTYNRAKERYQRALIRSTAASSSMSGSGAAPSAVQQQQQARLGPLAHLAAAAEAGVIVCFITNPVWVVKTRLQLQRRQLAQAAAAATAAQASGTAGAAAAVGSSVPRPMPAAAAGTVAGASGAPQYKGFIDCFVQIVRCEGLRGLYKGLLPSLLLVSHGAIQFAVYEELKKAAQSASLGQYVTPLLGGETASSSSSSSKGSRRGRESSSSSRREEEQQQGRQGQHGQQQQQHRVLNSAEITACGALSKLAASVATYPSQVVRSRLQQRMDVGRGLQYSGVLDVLRKTLAREGIGGLYKGLAPNVLRVMPQSALTFLVYESVMHALNPPSSSSSSGSSSSTS